MNRFIPEIYKRLGTSVSIDLGAAAKLGEIDEGVDGVQSKLDAVQAQQDAVADIAVQRFTALDSSVGSLGTSLGSLGASVGGLGTSLSSLNTSVTTLANDVLAEATLADQRHQAVLEHLNALQAKVDEIAAGQEDDDEDDDSGTGQQLAALSRRSVHVIRLLNELQSVVLRDKAPAQELADATQRAFVALDGDPVLQEQLTAAYGEFRGGTLAERSDRYWKLHLLIENVAAYWASGSHTTPAASRAAASV